MSLEFSVLGTQHADMATGHLPSHGMAHASMGCHGMVAGYATDITQPDRAVISAKMVSIWRVKMVDFFNGPYGRPTVLVRKTAE